MPNTCPNCGRFKGLMQRQCWRCTLRPQWDTLTEAKRKRLQQGLWPIVLIVAALYVLSGLMSLVFLPLGIVLGMISAGVPVYWSKPRRVFIAVHDRQPAGGAVMVILECLAGVLVALPVGAALWLLLLSVK